MKTTNMIMMKLSEKSAAIQAKNHDPYQEEVLDPCCEPYAQRLQLGFLLLDQSNLKWDWMNIGSLQSHSLATFTCWLQAVIHHLILCE